MVTQGSLGAAGEVSKSVVLGEEISAPGVVGEFFGEGPTSILEIATGYLEKTAKDKKAPKPEPEKGYVDVPTPEEWEKIPIENADESLDNLLDQVEAPKPDIQEKAEDVNQAQAEEKETKPEPTPEPAKEPVKDKNLKRKPSRQRFLKLHLNSSSNPQRRRSKELLNKRQTNLTLTA